MTHDLDLSKLDKPYIQVVWEDFAENFTQEKIEKNGILWLKSSKRGEDKSGKKIQGKGWEIYEPTRTIEENFKLFATVHELFNLENPNPKPNTDQYPTEIQIPS